MTAAALLTRPLLPVDETRYLAVAWEMWQHGDFLVPWLNGQPYSHKPPLLFWLVQAGWALFGVNAWSARLLAPLLALACLWLTARLARALWPDDPLAGPLAVWLLFGTLFWLLFMTLVQFDLLLTLCALLAFLGLAQAAGGHGRGWLLTGLGIGLGGLAKGPVILVAVLPPALLAPLWAPGRAGLRWYLGAAGALALGLLIALAWALPAAQAGGGAYRQAIFWGQSAGRVVHSFAHRAPWWTYLALLPLMTLPWVAWPPLWRRLRGSGLRLDAGLRFCLAGLLPALLLFSLISGKQAKYLLPLLPLLALLAARLLTRAGAADLLPRARRVATAMAALVVAAHLLVVPFVRAPFDVTPLARRIASLQAQGVVVANLGKYHGQYHFPGRLRQPLVVLKRRAAVAPWLRAHPRAWLLVYYPDPAPAVPAGVYWQRYRGGSVVLWPARLLIGRPARLDDPAASA